MSSTSPANEISADQLERAFRQRFGSSPAVIARAPGRVNLIGEHTDYNDGFVLPMAIDRAAWIAARPRTDRKVVLESLDFGDTRTIDLDEIERTVMARSPDHAIAPTDRSPLKPSGWQRYVQGVSWALTQAGHELGGWEGVMTGDVPVGAGLSSSAALELCVARTFAGLYDLPWNPAGMALLCQRAENEWVGVNCGIMDQLISAVGVEGHAVLIDCRSLATKATPIPSDAAVLVIDTGTRRGLVDSEYNARRLQCEQASAFFGVTKLRDVTVEQFFTRESELEPILRKRARHVVTENARTVQAAEQMATGDARSLGKLMNESHASLRDDFEVSSDALNQVVDIAQQTPGIFGARLTGAGFGGCAIDLIESRHQREVLDRLQTQFARHSLTLATLLPCQPTAGAQIFS